MMEEEDRSQPPAPGSGVPGRSDVSSRRALESASTKIPPKLKLSQILDSPSRTRGLQTASTVDAFGTRSIPSGVHDGQDLRKNPSGRAMHDPASMHTRVQHPDQYKPGPDTRLNPSGPRLKLSSERAAELEAADLKAGRGLRQAGEPVLRGDFELLFWSMFPEELRPACWNRFGGGNSPTVGNSLVIGGDGTVKWGEGATLSVYGTAGLYKGVFLRGWSKANSSAAWVAMTVAQEITNPPAKLDTSFVDGVDAYPWYAWRPTWDYARAH